VVPSIGYKFRKQQNFMLTKSGIFIKYMNVTGFSIVLTLEIWTCFDWLPHRNRLGCGVIEMSRQDLANDLTSAGLEDDKQESVQN